MPKITHFVGGSHLSAPQWFARAPCCRSCCPDISMASSWKFTIFYENKMAAKNFSTFYGFMTSRQHIFQHSPCSGQHYSLTKITVICMRLSAAPPQTTIFAKIDEVAALYWLHPRNGRGILTNLGIVRCDYPLAKNDASLRAIAQNLREILARELVIIYEVKISAK